MRIILYTISLLSGAILQEVASEPLFRAGEEFPGKQKERYEVRRADLGRPVSRYEATFFLRVSRDGPETLLLITAALSLPPEPGSQLREPVHSDLVFRDLRWQVRNGENVVRQWRPRINLILRDADAVDDWRGITVGIPTDELKESFLLLYIADIDSNGTNDGIVYEIDLRELEWPSAVDTHQHTKTEQGGEGRR